MATIPAALRPRVSRRAVASLLVGALGIPLAAGAGWLAFSSDDFLGEMELAATGAVSVLRGGETLAVDGTLDLEPLDVVMTQARSTAVFNLEGDRSIELAPESRARILGASGIGLEGGSAFADADDQLRVAVGEILVTNSVGGAVFRLDRASSVRTGVYEGRVQVAVPGERTLQIPRLHEASVPIAAPDVPLQPSPYGLVNADEWDARELGNVIHLDEQLRATASGLADQFGNARPPLAYYRGVAGTKVDFMRKYVTRSPANLIVALTVAKGSPSRSLGGGFKEALDLFDQGARWGVAAAIMKAKPGRLLASLDALIERSGVGGGNGQAANAFALATGGSDGSFGLDPDGSPAGGPTQSDPGTPVDDPNDPPVEPSPTPTEEPTDDPTDPPKECSDDIECTLQDIEPPVENPLEDEIGKKTGDAGSSLPGL